MSRYILIPDADDPTIESIKITIPTGLMDSEDCTPSNMRKVRKIMRRLNRQNVSVNSNGEVVLNNGHVLKGIKYDRALRSAMLGVRKKKYAEFYKLLLK